MTRIRLRRGRLVHRRTANHRNARSLQLVWAFGTRPNGPFTFSGMGLTAIVLAALVVSLAYFVDRFGF